MASKVMDEVELSSKRVRDSCDAVTFVEGKFKISICSALCS